MNDVELAPCPESTSKSRHFNEQVNESTNLVGKSMIVNQSKASGKYEDELLSAGLWLTTVVFLCLTMTFAVLSTLLALFNIQFNPANDFLGVWGLYVWNGTSIVLCSLTMIFWSSLYMIFIADNIGITDTLKAVGHYTSKDLSNLSFSFWILLASILCHFCSIGMVYYRNYELQREPKPLAITVKKNDSTILVY